MEQRIKKSIAILLAVLFLVSLAASAVSACSNYPAGSNSPGAKFTTTTASIQPTVKMPIPPSPEFIKLSPFSIISLFFNKIFSNSGSSDVTSQTSIIQTGKKVWLE